MAYATGSIITWCFLRELESADSGRLSESSGRGIVDAESKQPDPRVRVLAKSLESDIRKQ
jgi:hypothetical protein